MRLCTVSGNGIMRSCFWPELCRGPGGIVIVAEKRRTRSLSPCDNAVLFGAARFYRWSRVSLIGELEKEDFRSLLRQPTGTASAPAPTRVALPGCE